MRALLPLLAALTLAACASTPPTTNVVTQVVHVPVPVPCVVDAGPDPVLADSDAALAAVNDIYERVRLMLIGRQQARDRIAELHAASSGCQAPTPSVPVDSPVH